jgi:hypothetical protein
MSKLKKIFIIALISLCGFANANNLKRELDCGAVSTKDQVFAYFPIVVNRKKWEWYKIERTAERQEYAWIAEPGNKINKNFISSGVAFAISLGTFNLGNNPPEQGSLDDLLNKSTKNAYFTKKPESSKEEQKNIDFIFKSRVRAKQMEDESSIFIYPADPETIKEVKRGNPTHMRLKAILPNEDESYECIVKIEHMELKR